MDLLAVDKAFPTLMPLLWADFVAVCDKGAFRLPVPLIILDATAASFFDVGTTGLFLKCKL